MHIDASFLGDIRSWHSRRGAAGIASYSDEQVARVAEQANTVDLLGPQRMCVPDVDARFARSPEGACQLGFQQVSETGITARFAGPTTAADTIASPWMQSASGAAQVIPPAGAIDGLGSKRVPFADSIA